MKITFKIQSIKLNVSYNLIDHITIIIIAILIKYLLGIENEAKKYLKYYDVKNLSNFSLISSVTEHNADKPIIILADDNIIINHSNKKIFEKIIYELKLDFEIEIVSDGLDIIKLCLNNEKNYNNKIKAIFTDENMDYCSGSDAIRFIRNFERIKNKKPVIIVSITCNVDNKINDHIISAGADYVLGKPLSKNSVFNIFKICNFK